MQTGLLSSMHPLAQASLAQQMHDAPAFPHFCIDDFLETEFADEVHDAFPTYRQAERLGDAFNALNERKKIQITDATLFPAPILRLHDILASDQFVAALSRISGIEGLLADPTLSGGGIHETNQGGRLDVHVDFNFNEASGLYRRLNVLVYFNKDWAASFGGQLDLWDAEVKHCVGSFAPNFNRMACFATSEISWHGVTPVTCPTELTRKSFAAYYYTKETPPEWGGVKHSTLFRPRPHEFWRGKVAMPADDLLRATRSTVASVKRSLRGLLSD